MCARQLKVFDWKRKISLFENIFLQRAEASEREIEQIRSKLTEVTQKQKLGETTQEAPDMDRAIDMFKRSNLEHELASKEKEVKISYLFYYMY